MHFPNQYKYGSPDFIKFVKNLKKNRSGDKGRLICFQGGNISNNIKAAQYIAFDLNSPLIKINCSKIITKSIGETEKNLDRLFDEVESEADIIFLEEADVFFNSNSDHFVEELLQLILKSIDKSRRMVLLSVMSEAKRPSSSLEKFDSIIQFRELTK